MSNAQQTSAQAANQENNDSCSLLQETGAIMFQPGTPMQLAFNAADIETVVTEGSDLLIELKSGQVLRLANYETLMDGEGAAVLFADGEAFDPNAFLGDDACGGGEGDAAKMAAADATDVIVEEGAEETAALEEVAGEIVKELDEAIENSEEELSETEETAELNEAQIKVSELAEIESAAGEADDLAAIAEQLAQVEPAAGEAGAEAGGRGGFGFDSRPDEAPIENLFATELIGPTALQYGLPNFDDQTFTLEDSTPLNPPGLSVLNDLGEAVVKEDGSVFVPVTVTLSGDNASEQILTVLISGVTPSMAAGAGFTPTATPGVFSQTFPRGEGYDGGFTFTPEAESDINLGQFSVTAVVNIPETGQTESVTQDATVITDAVADIPEVDAHNEQGVEDSALELEIDGALGSDRDGSEEITSYVIELDTTETGFTFNRPVTDLGGNRFEFDPADIVGLEITPPAGFVGTVPATVTINVAETTLSDSEIDFSDNTNSATDTFTLEWVPDLRPPEVEYEFSAQIDGDTGLVKEDGSVTMFLNANLPPAAGSVAGDEELTVEISGVEPGWTTNLLSLGFTETSAGVYTITLPPGQNLDVDVTFEPPADSDADHPTLTITATVSDPEFTNTESDSTTADILTDAVIDAPNLSADNATAEEGTTIPLNIDTSVTDTDGSESITEVTITGFPTGSTFNNGTLNPAGTTLTLSPADLAGLTITIPDGTAADDYPLTVTSFAEETTLSGGEDDTSDNATDVRVDLILTVTEDTVPTVNPAPVTVDESNLPGGPITQTGDLNLDLGDDEDGSTVETNDNVPGVLTSGGVPVDVTQDGTVVTGTNTDTGETVFTLTINPDGTYTYEQEQPLDHEEGGSTDENLPLEFGITVTDGDGDEVNTTVTVNVADSNPDAQDDIVTADEGTGSVTGNILDNDTIGADTPGTLVSVDGVDLPTDGSDIEINLPNGTLTINNTGEYTYTITVNNPPAETLTFPYVLEDYDGDTDTANLVITVDIIDHQPTLRATGVSVDETDFNGAVQLVETGDIIVDFRGEGPGTVRTTGNGPAGLTSGGNPVDVAQDGTTFTGTGTVTGDTVFTLTLNDNGTYTYTQFENIDHPNPNAANESIALEFDIEAVDVDGDVTPATITVNVADDAPDAEDDSVSFKLEDGSVSGDVTENDTLSTDEANTVTEVNGVTISETGFTDVPGTYGTLSINADGEYTYTLDPTLTDPREFPNSETFPDLAERQPVSDPAVLGLDPADLDTDTDATGSVTFVSEGAGFNNTLGAFRVNADGTLSTGEIIIENGNDVATATTTFDIDGAPGQSLGFFLIADGFDQNDFAALDLDNGSIEFITNYGGADARTATIDDNGSDVSLVFIAQDGTETVLDGPTYFTTERGGSTSLNDDGNVRVVSGLADENDPTTLRIGFEDLPNLGDEDFNDIVFDLQITPNLPECIEESFTYTLQDGDLDTDEATLTLKCEKPDVTISLSVANGADEVIVKEDGEVEVSVSTSVAGGNGNETVTLTLSGVEAGWIVEGTDWDHLGGGVYQIELPVGQSTYNGNLTFEPPADSDLDLSGLNIVAAVFDPDTGETTTTDDGFGIITDAVIDLPEVDVIDTPTQFWHVRKGAPATDLDIFAAVTDTDGSETITKVVIDLNQHINGSKPGFETLAEMGITLNKGTETSPGVWEVPVNNGDTTAALDGLQLEIPAGRNYGPIHQNKLGALTANIPVKIHAEETNLGGEERDFNDNSVVVTRHICLTFRVTPLVLDLDGDGIEVLSIEEGVFFDMNNNGTLDQTGWISGDDAFLAIDLNNDGLITSQSELFGDTATAIDGFANLAAYDENGDGVVDSGDSAFGELVLWQDLNTDGISDAGELMSLSDAGVASINVNATDVAYNLKDSFVSGVSTFTFADGSEGEVADVWFNAREGEVLGAGATVSATEGNDVLYGTENADLFFFTAVDQGTDEIRGFDVDQGDVLDLGILLAANDDVTDAIAEFVRFTDNGTDTVIEVDVDGAAGAEEFTQLVTLQGVTGLDVEDVAASGALAA